MKSPKEKAMELINRFYYMLPNNGSLENGINSCKARMNEAIQCALISVEEIIESRKDDDSFDDTLFQITSVYSSPHPMYLTYWLKVIEEIKYKLI